MHHLQFKHFEHRFEMKLFHSILPLNNMHAQNYLLHLNWITGNEIKCHIAIAKTENNENERKKNNTRCIAFTRTFSARVERLLNKFIATAPSAFRFVYQDSFSLSFSLSFN